MCNPQFGRLGLQRASGVTGHLFPNYRLRFLGDEYRNSLHRELFFCGQTAALLL
jgi:hypothetical protein